MNQQMEKEPNGQKKYFKPNTAQLTFIQPLTFYSDGTNV